MTELAYDTDAIVGTLVTHAYNKIPQLPEEATWAGYLSSWVLRSGVPAALFPDGNVATIIDAAPPQEDPALTPKSGIDANVEPSVVPQR